MDADEILLTAEEKMEKALEMLTNEAKGLRTGRASPVLVEHLRVEAYGSLLPIKQVASITTPDARLLVIKPFDASILKDVEKAIQKSELGINPSNDGKLIRLAIPPLSEERRKQMVGTLKEMTEKCKVALRNVRRDANKDADTAEDDGTLTEDQHRQLKDDIQELIKTYEKKVEEFLEKKSAEILQV